MRKSLIASVAAAAVGIVALAPAAASADESAPTLAGVLTADSGRDNADGFDRRFWDYDSVTQALIATNDIKVLDLDGDGELETSLLEAASNPDLGLTAFVPNDFAFRRLAYELGLGVSWRTSEADVFNAIVGFFVEANGGDVPAALESINGVLAYHILGIPVSFSDAKALAPVTVNPVGGGEIDVAVKGRWFKRLQLTDDSGRRMIVVQPDIGGEASNGYAHGISRVLLPAG